MDQGLEIQRRKFLLPYGHDNDHELVKPKLCIKHSMSYTSQTAQVFIESEAMVGDNVTWLAASDQTLTKLRQDHQHPAASISGGDT